MKQWNQSNFGGAALALGICAGAALYQPTAARSAGEDGANNPQRPHPAEHKFGGPTGQKFGGQNPGGQPAGGRPGEQNNGGPMRPEMLMQQLNLTPQQQAQVQAIYEQEREQMRLIHQKTRAGIEAILTAEQKTQFAQMPMSGPPQNGPRGGQRDGNRPPMQNGMQHEMQDRDHGRPVELIARDLGVTPEQFRAAFEKVRPAARGEQPTEVQRQANRKVLSETLGVAPEKLDAVMDKYRPEGPPNRQHEDRD